MYLNSSISNDTMHISCIIVDITWISRITPFTKRGCFDTFSCRDTFMILSWYEVAQWCEESQWYVMIHHDTDVATVRPLYGVSQRKSRGIKTEYHDMIRALWYHSDTFRFGPLSDHFRTALENATIRSDTHPHQILRYAMIPCVTRPAIRVTHRRHGSQDTFWYLMIRLNQILSDSLWYTHTSRVRYE